MNYDFKSKVVAELPTSTVYSIIFAQGTLMFDPAPGKKVSEIIKDAIEFLDSKNVTNGVIFGLNGVTLKIRPDSSVEEVMANWNEERDKNRQYYAKKQENSANQPEA